MFRSIYIIFGVITGFSATLHAQMAIESPRPTPEQKLEQQFISPRLSQHQLKGFETRVIQKLEDLEGYLNIIANPKYDYELRNQAHKMALDLFVNKEQAFLPKKIIF